MNERKNNLIKQLKGVVTMANTIINGGASPYPKGASGDIITITDGAENTPLKSAVVNIEPVQDLHGYDSPWPAGGGYNILPDGNTISKLNDAGLTVTLTDTTLSGYTATKVAVTGTAASWGWRIYTSGIRSVLQPETAYKITFLASAAYTFAGMIATTGSASKLCGNINFTRTQLSNGLYEYAGTFTTYASTDAGWSVSDQVLLLYLNPATTSPVDFTIVNGICLTASTAPDGYYAYSNTCPISGWSEVDVWVKPTYDTSLTPTATIDLGQTVYGGTLDVVRGKLVVDRAMVTFDGTESWATTANYCYRFGYSPSAQNGGSSQIGSHFSTTFAYSGGNSLFAQTNGAIVKSNEASTEALTSYLAGQYANGTPVQLCYELATPIEVDLTPQTIKTLLGTNNIWADAGEMSIEYYPAAASIVAVQNRSTKAYVSIPLGMIRYETYQITPQQTIDLDSYRSENGNLLRNPVATKCKLEFNTPLMTDTQWGEIWNIIKAGFNNNTERKLKLKYYDTLSATYKTGYFYVPDVQTTIRNIDEATGTINYNEIRLAFIEY